MDKVKMSRALLCAAALIGACAAPDDASGPTEPATPNSGRWSFEAAAADLRARSCPEGVAFQRAEALDIAAEPVPFGEAARVADALDGLDYVGGWALSSENAAFGGLSGLAVLPSGTLLTVSDDGAFIWINMDPDAEFAPSGSGAIAFFRGGTGAIIGTKHQRDAEGLALRDGLALVSFERDHRIGAFDLEGCGAAARQAGVTKLSEDGLSRVADNRGMEALALVGDALFAAAERKDQEAAGAGYAPADGGFALLDRIEAPGAPLVTGADELDGKLYVVARDYNPVMGNTIDIRVHELDEAGRPGAPKRLARLKRPLAVDNFEAIAALRRPDGGARLVLVSDDNFNPRQRTLLMAFDVVGEAG